MSLLCWNYRGLVNPGTVLELCHLVRVKKLLIVFLMETEILSKTVKVVQLKLEFENGLEINLIGRKGGITLL